MVVCGCTGIGFCVVFRYASRLRILGELERILYFLHGEIEYAGCDMLEILDKLAERSGYFQSFWRDMKKELQRYDGKSFSECWGQTFRLLDEVWKNLTAEDKELFLEVGENLGNLDRSTQLHTLEIFQERVHAGICQAREEYRQKAKVSLTVGVTAGLFLALVLL